jgi:hypothetical protein
MRETVRECVVMKTRGELCNKGTALAGPQLGNRAWASALAAPGAGALPKGLDSEAREIWVPRPSSAWAGADFAKRGAKDRCASGAFGGGPGRVPQAPGVA